jgi:hypothetical protein
VLVTMLAVFTTQSKNGRQVLAGGDSGGSQNVPSAAPPTAASNGQLKVDKPAVGSINEALPSAALPQGPKYSVRGAGTFATIAGTSPVIGKGPVHRFSIDIENGITGIDHQGFSSLVMQSLSSAKSWTSGGIALQRVESGPVDFHITLVSSMTVRTICGYDLPVETSCFSDEHDKRVVLNVARWVRGDVAYIADLQNYRRYMVNHEVGHALGHAHAHGCLSNGYAPVMMQQTITLKAADGKQCQANPWPYPDGVADAPGAEVPGS